MHLWLTNQTCIIEEEKKQNIYVYIIYIFIIIDLKQKKWLLLSEEAFEFALMSLWKKQIFSGWAKLNFLTNTSICF